MFIFIKQLLPTNGRGLSKDFQYDFLITSINYDRIFNIYVTAFCQPIGLDFFKDVQRKPLTLSS